MGYKKSADGVAKKGRTDVEVFPNDGAKKGIEKGGKKSAGVTSLNMKKYGRNLARAMNQKASGRGR